MTALIYVADPMCSWCYGFREPLAALRAGLPAGLPLRYVMGGLAPDSDDPMPEETRRYVQDAWRAVAARTGAAFNWEFWDRCTPRRSTYPACRAVIAAGLRDPDAVAPMFDAIQRAYYREARDPSDVATLVDLARSLTPGLDPDAFGRDLASPEVEERLQADLAHARALGVRGFPSLFLERAGTIHPVQDGWGPVGPIRERLSALLAVQ